MRRLKQLLGLSRTKAYELLDSFIEKHLADWGTLTKEQKEERIRNIQEGKTPEKGSK